MNAFIVPFNPAVFWIFKMALINPTNSPKPQIVLIPWDPTSPEHVERLVQQRIACGWDSECVESWRKAQESGKLNNQWIVSILPPIDFIFRVLNYLGACGF